MAFNINPGKQQFIATTSQTVFTFNFAIFADTDIKVYKTLAGAVADDINDVLTLTTDYSVSINGTLGGTVTLSSGAGVNDIITLARALPISRTTDYVTNGDLYADTLDLDQDYQTYLVLDQQVRWERSLVLPESYDGDVFTLPAPDALKMFRWDVSGTYIENIDPSNILDTTNGIIVDTVADLATIDTALHQTAIVKDLDRGGTFIWSSTGTANGGTVFAGATGYWTRQYSGAVNVKWFGANTTRTDNEIPVNLIISSGILDIYFPSGTFTISNTILYETSLPMIVAGEYVDFNGIKINGAGIGKTIIKASATFPNNTSMIKLNGNALNSSDNTNPVSQIGNTITNLTIDGNSIGIGVTGLSITANWKPLYRNINITHTSGTGIYIGGTTVVGKDDADTTGLGEFDNVTVQYAGAYGYLGVSSRQSQLLFNNCNFKWCYSDGVRIAGVGITFNNTTVSSCGNSAQITTGGIRIVKSATQAVTRGIRFTNCEFEANYWHEINIDYALSYEISNCVFNPYQKSALSTAQATIDLGATSATNGIISNIRIQDYSDTYGYNITGIKASATTNILNINSVSFGHSTGKTNITSATNVIFENTFNTGLKFANITTSDNTLNMYEFGTFTLTNITSGTQTNKFIRIGNLVTFVARIDTFTLASATSLGGLPVSGAVLTPCSVYVDGVTLGADKIFNFAINGTTILLRVLDLTTGGYVNLQDLTGTTLVISGSYIVT